MKCVTRHENSFSGKINENVAVGVCVSQPEDFNRF